MKLIVVSKDNDTIRRRFFSTAFGENRGYIGVASKKGDQFGEAYFLYPDDLDALLEWINRQYNNRNLYFCPQLLSRPKRTKQNVIACPTLWADIDEVEPEKVKPKPSVLLQTSPGRYQGLWILKQPADPAEAEDASRRLAYSIQADPSGWDLTQLLRIPVTYNTKYEVEETPIVEILTLDKNRTYTLDKFLSLDEVPEFKKSQVPFPKEEIDALEPDEVLRKYRSKLLPYVYSIYEKAPEGDMSSILWSLECMLFEAGLSEAEVHAVAWGSAVNKYQRDGRPQGDLWREVLKAKAAIDLKRGEDIPPITPGDLLTEKERKRVASLAPSFVEKYIEWGKSRSDAAWQYHEAGAFVILSSIIAEGIRLRATAGTIIPNLWFMLLGDTTLTRKTTAMDMAMENLLLVYEDAILATDGSIEGLLTALSQRPQRTGLFLRDEFSGLLESMKKRDYYTGMMEALTKLYDGKYQKRVLRKEVIEVRDPIFIMFCGGIKSRIIELLDIDYIISGFLPRFIFIVADPDIRSLKPLGPQSVELTQLSAGILETMSRIRERYSSEMITVVGDQSVETKKIWDATLTPEAWDRYNLMEFQLTQEGLESDSPDLYTPSLSRLSVSGLKAAVLIAASAQDPKEKGEVIVELDDMLRAIKYVEGWRTHSLYVVQNAGKSVSEKSLDRAIAFIKRGKDSRAALMRTMKLDSKQTNMLLDTLEERGSIIRTKHGKTEKLYPTGL